MGGAWLTSRAWVGEPNKEVDCAGPPPPPLLGRWYIPQSAGTESVSVADELPSRRRRSYLKETRNILLNKNSFFVCFSFLQQRTHLQQRDFSHPSFLVPLCYNTKTVDLKKKNLFLFSI
jgi:hypothetical protein